MDSNLTQSSGDDNKETEVFIEKFIHDNKNRIINIKTQS